MLYASLLRKCEPTERETEKMFGFDDVEYADDSNFIQINHLCLPIFAMFYIFEGRLYGAHGHTITFRQVQRFVHWATTWATATELRVQNVNPVDLVKSFHTRV